MRAGPGASLAVTSELTSESHLGDGAPPDLSGVWIQDAITSVTAFTIRLVFTNREKSGEQAGLHLPCSKFASVLPYLWDGDAEC